MKIDKVYIGIPSELKSLVFWIGREFRKNDLSFKEGGTSIIVEYTNGKVFGYDWIKYPSRYVKKIFDFDFLNSSYINELDFIKENVSRIYARKYSIDNYTTETFIEVWNNKTSNNLPYPILDNYTVEIYKSYLSLFLKNIDFAKQYISIHYPFDYRYLIDYWPYFEKGSAHYCTFISDIDWVYPSVFGLSYNKNIRWNSKLRAKFEYGFSNPYEGYIEGTGSEPVEYDEQDYLDIIIPLDAKKEIESREFISFKISSSIEEYEKNSIDLSEMFDEHNYLEFHEFKSIFKKNRLKALINDSIWDNTLSFIIDGSFCDKIIDDLKMLEIEKLKKAHNNG